jgi:uncharacterized protein (DUF2141 family)
MNRLLRASFVLALLTGFTLSLWSCSEDGGGPTGGGDTDTKAPTVASVTGIDQRHIEIQFDERVDRPTAERTTNYLFIEGTPPPVDAEGAPGTPGDTVVVFSVVVGSDEQTVTVTTDTMQDAPYNYGVQAIKDLNGNTMSSTATGTFQGTNAGDQTAPQMIFRSPAPGATGVGRGEPVVVQFDEPVFFSDLVTSTTWIHGGGIVVFEADVDESSNTAVFTPVSQLPASTTFTVSFDTTFGDFVGNNFAGTSWSFTTASGSDTDPPTLQSTTPNDGQTNVPVDINLQIRFSERIAPGEPGFLVTPQIGDGVESRSADGRTLSFDPDSDLQDDQQYTLLIPQGAVSDMAGNKLEESSIIRFNTGSSAPVGRISGTLSGDPDSPQASSPDGAIVFVTTSPIFADDEGEPSIPAAQVVDASGDYDLRNLENGTYYPTSILDSNGDGLIDTDLGDAVGAWGINLHPDTMDTDQGSIPIASNHDSNIDFRLWDQTVIAGHVAYVGTQYTGEHHDHYIYAGAFRTAGFDPDSVAVTPPDYNSDEIRLYRPEFQIGGFGVLIDNGAYYVGAYMDANDNEAYDPAVDPAGFYMTGGEIDSVSVADGSDALGLVILLEDPSGGGAATSAWRQPTEEDRARASRNKQLSAAIKKALANSHNQR